ncbi:MAG: 6-phosphogluconolactonase [Desulfomonilia bacterium]|nr:6-phosphogluconolactonase [Desulfomonilia bacterium]
MNKREGGKILTVGLSGGRTPSDLYDFVAGCPREFPWEIIHMFLVDERFVPIDQPESNYKLIEDHLLKPLALSGNTIHPVMTEGLSMDEAAAKYESDLHAFFSSPPDVPSFDLILLGIGDDGHTASLFPGARELNEDTRLVVPVKTDRIPHERITMTLPLINNARNVVFFVTGKNKALIMKKLLYGRNAELPASRVRPTKGSLKYVLDDDAFSNLDFDSITGDVLVEDYR